MQAAIHQPPHVLGQLFAKLGESHPDLLTQLLARLNEGEAKPSIYPPLHLETRDTVDTAAAAHYLNRRPQTLRGWAAKSGTGPIEPIRISGRLAWHAAAIRALLGVAQ